MRHYTSEEEQLFKKLDDKNLSEEERKKIIEELKRIEIEVTNGMIWLT